MINKTFVTFLIVIIANGSEQQQQHTREEVREKFATPCTTPNGDSGLCVEVQKCPILIDSLTSGNKKNHNFIRASRCGPENEHIDQPKVCCGAHADYTNNKGGSVARSTTTKRPKLATSVHPSIQTTKDPNSDDDPFTEKCGNQTLLLPSRIYGGTTADIGEFPWIARLRHKRQSDGMFIYGCVGFLISKRFVLTAAHCILSKDLLPIGPVYQVELGEHNTKYNPDCVEFSERKWCADPPQLLRTAKPITHKEYSSRNQYNDIALIPLKEAAKFTDFVYPICLASSNSLHMEMWISGWGKTESRVASPAKIKVTVPRVSNEICKEIYVPVGVHLIDTQICAGGEAGKDSCTGDSGGPLMTQTGSEPWYAEGIVSLGMGCGLEGWPGIYTNIIPYRPWIKKMANRYLKKRQEKREKRKNNRKGN